MEDPFSGTHRGVYYNPTDSTNLKDFQNRQAFLRIAAQHVPGFAESFCTAALGVMGERIKQHGSLPSPNEPDFREYYSHFYDAVRTWARKYNIEVDWVINEAPTLAASILHYRDKGIAPILAFGTWRRTIRVKKAYRNFSLPAWDPEAELPGDYVVRVDREWRRVRDDYIKKTKADLAAAGMKPIPLPRKSRLTNERRFIWAALHQCLGKSVDEIAEDSHEETEVVRISVARVIEELGFTPPT